MIVLLDGMNWNERKKNYLGPCQAFRPINSERKSKMKKESIIDAFRNCLSHMSISFWNNNNYTTYIFIYLSMYDHKMTYSLLFSFSLARVSERYRLLTHLIYKYMPYMVRYFPSRYVTLSHCSRSISNRNLARPVKSASVSDSVSSRLRGIDHTKKKSVCSKKKRNLLLGSSYRSSHISSERVSMILMRQ